MNDVQKKMADEFTRTEITVTGDSGETVFTLSKMPATKGWDTLEEIREATGGVMNVEHSGGANAAIAALVASMPKPFVRRLRSTMFEHVTFTNRVMQTPTVLAGNEETAFDMIGAKPVEIYELFLRILAVNFTDSFVAVKERISTLLK